MTTYLVNGQVIAAQCLSPRAKPTAVSALAGVIPDPPSPAELPRELPPIGGGQEEITLDGLTFNIGELVAVVIQGDGPQGTFVGRLAAVTNDSVLLFLTEAVGPIPAGTVVAIRQEQIAAVARLFNGNNNF